MAKKTVRLQVLENALSEKPLKWRDLAHLIGVAPASVYRTATRLRAEGLLPKSPVKIRDKTAYASELRDLTPDPPPGTPTFWEAKDVVEVVNSPVMSESDRLRRLSEMARNGADAISIAAIKALEDLGRSRGTTVGPGPPLTVDDQITRLSRLMLAVGPEVAARASEAAFGQKVVPAPTSEAPTPPGEASEPDLEANVELQEETR